jgi:hypothetical protein
LRAYPTPPSLSEQTFVPHVKQFVGGDANAATEGEDLLLKARLWNYRCRYEYVGATHDKILASVKLNAPPKSGVQARLVDGKIPDLFEALVQFTAAYPAIAKDLDQYLVTETDRAKAFNAISSFAWLAQRAANAWLVWQQDAGLDLATPLNSPEYHFVITQRAENMSTVTALLVTVTWAESSPRLPQKPSIEIAGYTTKERSQTADSVSYYFVGEQDQEILTFEIGRNLSTRQMVFADLDILKIENAWAGAAVKRNEDLLPDQVTNPDFVFQSPVVRFANVLTPLLDPDIEIDVADYTVDRPAELANYLSNFLIAFFAAAETVGNENRTIRLAVGYSYGLQDSGEVDLAIEEMPDLDITIPILLTTPTSISILPEDLSPDSPFIAAVSDTVYNWFHNNTPSGVHESGKLWFDLSVYSSLSESQLPVLRMRRLYLASKLLIFDDGGE